MKLYRTLLKALPVIAILCLTSCKDAKNDDQNQNDGQEISDKKTEMELKNDDERQSMPEDAAGAGPATQTGGTTGAYNNVQVGTEPVQSSEIQNLSGLYEHLKMTDKQIDDFENAMGDNLNEVENANGEVFGTVYQKVEDKLESFLNQKQLEKYREWKKER